MILRHRLELVRGMSPESREERIRELTEQCPVKPWPFGMPASAYPHVVVIGVSPGNSPRREHRGFDSTGKPARELPTFGQPPGGFFYQDGTRYWEKTADLCRFLVRCDEPELSDDECLALAAHLNLGTGQYGKARLGAIEPAVVRWVSWLLANKFAAKVVVLFGLGKLLRDPQVTSWWNHSTGLSVDWSKPAATRKFGRYAFRLWSAKRTDGSEMTIGPVAKSSIEAPIHRRMYR